MSLNIQTANGLLEIGGKVTQEKIVEALGYEPADKAHTKDKNIHVTSTEKETWNNKSNVKHYDDLEGAPNITENDSGDMIIADNNGNIIMQVDENGLTTTDVNAKTMNLNGKDLGVRLDELEASSLPNILDNETGDLTIADENGNTIMKVNADGLETTTVTSKSLVVNDVNVETTLDAHKEDIDNLINHTKNTVIHITDDERILWNNKSEFSGDFNDLTNAPDIKEDNSGEVVYVDEDGNVIAKIGETGFKTTTVTADAIVVNGTDLQTTLNGKSDIGHTHNQYLEADDIATLPDKDYVDRAIDESEKSASNKDAVVLSEAQKGINAMQDTLNEHTTDTSNPHNVTKAQVGLGNVDNTSDANKPVSTAQQAALNTLKSELSESIVSESREWIVTDEDGNVVARIDMSGFETTDITAKNIVVDGIDVAEALKNLGGAEAIPDSEIIALFS